MLERKMSLSDIQNAEFQILLFIDELCNRENIRYSLDSGTLLGAVRNQDFIPWDDDIDLIMTRDNYDRFLDVMRESKNKRYQLLNYSTTPNYNGTMFSKVVDTETKAIQPGQRNKSPLGVFVDIFPIDYLPNNRIHRESILFKFMIAKIILESRVFNNLPFAKKAIGAFAFFIPTKFLCSSVDRYSKKRHAKTNYSFNLTFVTMPRLHQSFSSSLFEKNITLPFHKKPLPCVQKYDEYLKLLYGDYMTLPPVEERYSHSLDGYFLDDEKERDYLK
jgi:lipopolysaccharide cholinephosphotransferase